MEFFTTKAPDPIHWTNLCFGEFRTIWVHLGRFGCLKKLDAKRSELVQNFVPRSRIRIFRNERTRSTPLDPKLMFWCVSYRLAFGTVRLPYETRCKTGRTNAKVYATKSHWNFSQRNHPIHPIGPFTHVLVNFEPFGCIWDHYVALRNSVQMVRTSAKLRATKSHQNFSQRTHPIHPIGP